MSVPRTFSVVYLERHTNGNRSEKKDVHPVLIATGLFVYRLLHEKIATTEPNTREKKEEEELNTTISSECHLPNYTSVQWWIVETKISKYLLLFWYLTVPHFVFTYSLYEPRRFHVLIEIFCCVFVCVCVFPVSFSLHEKLEFSILAMAINHLLWREHIIIAWQPYSSISVWWHFGIQAYSLSWKWIWICSGDRIDSVYFNSILICHNWLDMSS